MMIKLCTYFTKWRKVKILSATFFCLLFLVISCKKDKNPLGENALPDGSSLSSDGVDTFSVRTYSITEDSTITKNPQFNLLGIYNDPELGKVEANFYTQFSLSGFSPDFGNLDDVIIDSMILAFRYGGGGYYGTPEEQLFEVYELDQKLSEDSTYYYFSTANVKPNNLVPTGNNEGLIKPTPNDESIVNGISTNPQLRIPINPDFAKEMMQIASESSSNEEFREKFNGLHVKVNTPTPAVGKGSILSLASANPASKLTVYFRQNDTVKNNFDFLITNQLIDFNHLEFDQTGSNLERVLEDTVLGQETFYAQGHKVRAKIEFPSLKDIPESAVLHSATLELPVNYFVGSDFYPSQTVTVAAKLFEGDDRRYLISENINYNLQRRAYIIDLIPYIQGIISGEHVNDGIVVSPRLFNTSIERIIFNGSNTMNKKQPKLNIVYTTF